MQASVTEIRPYDNVLAPAKNQSVAKLSTTETRFLAFFYKSVVVFTVLAMILSWLQMGKELDATSLGWSLVCNGSVGASVGMLFALMHDVIIKGRLEDE